MSVCLSVCLSVCMSPRGRLSLLVGIADKLSRSPRCCTCVRALVSRPRRSLISRLARASPRLAPPSPPSTAKRRPGTTLWCSRLGGDGQLPSDAEAKLNVQRKHIGFSTAASHSDLTRTAAQRSAAPPTLSTQHDRSQTATHGTTSAVAVLATVG